METNPDKILADVYEKVRQYPEDAKKMIDSLGDYEDKLQAHLKNLEDLSEALKKIIESRKTEANEG